MHFSEPEINIARQLKSLNLNWTPQSGHYVYDETEFCHQPSPFQDRVYFVLNYPYFMKAVGGVERFRQMMTWLPTWYDARQILSAMDVTNQQVYEHLLSTNSIQKGQERLALYRLILEELEHAAAV